MTPGRASVIWRWMLASISASVTEQRQAEAERQHHGGGQGARPVDVAQRQPELDVAGPGQGAGRRHEAPGDEAQRREDQQRRPDVVGGQPVVLREADGTRRQRRHGRQERQAVAEPQAAGIGLDGVAEQRRHRHVVDAAERRQREHQRGEEAVEGAEPEGGRMDPGHHGERDHGAEARHRRIGQGGADQDARQHAEQRHQHHLRRGPWRRPSSAGRAEGFQHGEARALALHRGLHGVGDADAAHHERRQADERQELGEAAEVAVEFGGHVVAGLDLPAGLGEGRAGIGHEAAQRGVVGGARQGEPRRELGEGAGLDQPGGVEPRAAHQHPGAKAMPPARRSGSERMIARKVKSPAPIFTASPTLTPSRSASAASAASPWRPSR